MASKPLTISQSVKEWFKSFSKSASQQSSRTPTPSADSSSPLPRIGTGSTVGNKNHLSAPSNVPLLQLPTGAPELVITAPASSTSEVAQAPGGYSPLVIESAQPDPKPEPGTQSLGFGLTTLEVALRTLHKTARVFPPLQPAINTLISCLELVQAADRNIQDHDDLTTELRNLNEIMVKYSRELESTSMSDCAINVVESINEEVRKLSKRREQGWVAGVLRASMDEDDLSRCIRRIQSLLRRLEVDVSLSAWGIANEHLANTRLEALLPVKVAGYNSALPEDASIVRRKCTENTRTEILSGLNSWSNNPEGEKVYWMNGMAGTGKTTIACSLSAALAKRKQLAASFFCTRTLPECRDARRVVPTIAYQLARYSRPFQSALCKVLEREPDIASEAISTQVERLLREPLSAVKDAIPNNVVVVIDALDECGDIGGVRAFLNELFRFAEDIAIKFFVTSRPEPGISDKITSQANHTRSILYLHEIEKSLVQADIELYLKEELATLSASEEQIKQLAQLAGNLFIYAATAVRYIRPAESSRVINSQARLRSVLSVKSESTKQYKELDALYSAILKQVLDADDLEEEELREGRLVLWTAVCAREPVTVETLAALVGQDIEHTREILHSLRSVLHTSASSHLVSTLHASFPDFIFTQQRSQQFFCDEKSHSLLLAKQCFAVMRSELKFNICKLQSSFVLDESVEDLQQRIEAYISQPLFYACRYWADHFSAASPKEDLGVMLEDFLSKRLLFWMEVLNLNNINTHSIAMLQTVQPWLLGDSELSALSRLVSDADTFVTAFSANSISQSTPHIYISALPFFHKSVPLLVGYWGRMRGLISLEGTAAEQMGAAALANWPASFEVKSITISQDGSLIAFGGGESNGFLTAQSGEIGVLNRYNGKLVAGPFVGHSSLVSSVAFSPDGTRIVSGSWDKTICVWNAQGGKLVAGPFKGHINSVTSVAFSPDGMRVVSGSEDRTVCVWNSQDGKLLTGPFKGHTASVNSVAFSPDGMRIVSGTHDKAIYVWSARDGKILAGPFKGHDASVNSVAFSPDGTRIVSGSADRTICVWDAQAGQLIAGPFQGHTNRVNSVAFSPDGIRIASSSDDNTICVWNGQDGRLVAGPFKGHKRAVSSVAFSPVGMRIVSGSSDSTISVWNAQDVKFIAGPFNGHTNIIRSAAFSPDGMRIVSGSYDKGICVWRARDGKLLAGPFKGHTASVNSVAFSPDGMRIVSGSNDATVRVWNAQDGKAVASPFKGHANWVNSVAYSPDGTRIVSGGADGTIYVWNAEDGNRFATQFEGHTWSVNSVVFSPDGTRIISGSDDETICVWNSQDGKLALGPLTMHTSWVTSVALSPDGTLIASGSSDRTVCVWDAQDGRLLAGPFEGHTDTVRSVAFSPDGTSIISASDDKTIWVWNAQDGEHLAGPFKGHTDAVNSVAFSPDGTRIASCSHDFSLRMTSLQTITVSAPALQGEWNFTASGWVVNKSGDYLFWVPKHLRTSLPRPYEAWVVDSQGSLCANFDELIIGDSWSECYVGG